MTGNTLPGVLVLLAVTGVTALGELPQAWVSVHTGHVRGHQVGRVLVTGWLLWRVWAGAAWARWLTAVLFLVGAGGLAAVTFIDHEADSRTLLWWPDLHPIVRVFGVAYAMCAGGLASPWVGVYQAACRGGPAYRAAEYCRCRATD